MKEEIKLKIKQLKNKIKNLPIENPFDFADIVEKQKEENEIDLGLFLELAEENKIIYNQVPINILVEDLKKLKMVSLQMVISHLVKKEKLILIDFSKTVMN